MMATSQQTRSFPLSLNSVSRYISLSHYYAPTHTHTHAHPLTDNPLINTHIYTTTYKLSHSHTLALSLTLSILHTIKNYSRYFNWMLSMDEL